MGDMTTAPDPHEVHLVHNLWAVGDDDHRFVTEAEAREFAAYLRRQEA